jgi:hypothetical protein
MAVYAGSWIYKDIEIMRWLDPNRYRVTIWGRSFQNPQIRSRKLKRLHDKDSQRIIQRAIAWIDKNDRFKVDSAA